MSFHECQETPWNLLFSNELPEPCRFEERFISAERFGSFRLAVPLHVDFDAVGFHIFHTPKILTSLRSFSSLLSLLSILSIGHACSWLLNSWKLYEIALSLSLYIYMHAHWIDHTFHSSLLGNCFQREQVSFCHCNPTSFAAISMAISWGKLVLAAMAKRIRSLRSFSSLQRRSCGRKRCAKVLAFWKRQVLTCASRTFNIFFLLTN